MKKAYSVVLSVLMCMALCVFNTGCSSSQTAKTVNIVVAEAEVALQSAAAFANLRNDPTLGAFFESVYNAAVVDLPLIKDAGAAWTANKSAGNLSALSAAVNTLASEVNAQILAANKVANTDSQKSVLAALLLFSATINGMAAALSGVSAKLALPRGYREVLALTPRPTQEQVAKAYGVGPGFVAGM
ncbi:MAG: hypothetical protein ABSD63_04215 [Candidatus Korobacteraceae bacterium]